MLARGARIWHPKRIASVDEYLEKVFSEGLKREIDSDESVWRTLPFFATALGITGTLLGYDGSELPSLSLTFLSLALYGLLGAGILCLALSFAWLFNAVRQREYRYPPSEVDLYALANEYRTYHVALGLHGEDLEARVVQDVRAIVVDEYARSASTNREHNRSKLFSRSQAIFFLMVGLAICFAYGSLAFVQQRLGEPHRENGGPTDVTRAQLSSPPSKADSVEPRAGREARFTPASAAAAPPANSGGCPSLRAHTQDCGPVIADKPEMAPPRRGHR